MWNLNERDFNEAMEELLDYANGNINTSQMRILAFVEENEEDEGGDCSSRKIIFNVNNEGVYIRLTIFEDSYGASNVTEIKTVQPKVKTFTSYE